MCGLPKEKLGHVVLVIVVANVTASWARRAKNWTLTRCMLVKTSLAHL